MRKVLGLAAAATLTFDVFTAGADELAGTIEEIDVATGVFTVDGKQFKAMPENTLWMTLEGLKTGDQVRVSYKREGAQTAIAINIHPIRGLGFVAPPPMESLPSPPSSPPEYPRD